MVATLEKKFLAICRILRREHIGTSWALRTACLDPTTIHLLKEADPLWVYYMAFYDLSDRLEHFRFSDEGFFNIKELAEKVRAELEKNPLPPLAEIPSEKPDLPF